MKNLATILLSFAVVTYGLAQVPKPAEPQSGPIAISNVTIHVGDGQVIENGTVAFDNGVITFVGSDASSFDLGDYRTIDGNGQQLYPGLILPATTLGLVDINAVRPTRDYNEVGQFTPHVRSLIAYNTDSELIAAMRYNGILLAQSAPTGGRMTGTSSVMMLDGWNWEDAAYKVDDGIHLNWPSLTFGARWWLGETARRNNDNYDEQVTEIEKFFDDVKAYQKQTEGVTNLLLASAIPLLTGEKTLYVYADNSQAIVDAVQSLKAIGVPNIVLVGGRDAWRVADFIKEHDIPILLGDVHARPSRDDEDVDLAYKMPKILTDAGIKVGLTYEGLTSARNLPFYAGTASAYGLTREQALQLITKNSADILGIGDRAGTIEVGKDAILFVSEGDVLDMRTSKVTMAFIQGKELELEGKQQRLYERFREKYGE